MNSNGTSTFADDITTFSYTLTAAPNTLGGSGVSHVLFASFCVTPTNYTAGEFLQRDGATDDFGLKRENVKIGDTFTFTFTFDGNYDAAADGARITIKQGDDARTVTLEGPSCPARQDVVCEGDTEPMTKDANGDGKIDQADCDYVAPFECGDGSDVTGDVDGDGDFDQADCDYVAPGCPEGQLMVDGKCVTPFVPTVPVIDVIVVAPQTCPDGTAMTDVNGDGQLTAADCARVLPDTGVTPPPAPTLATPAEPAAPGEPATPAIPAEPVPSVLPDSATPTVVPVVAPAPAPAAADNAVLGAQVTRAPLARTGSSTTGLAAFGALLVLLGAGATVASRRTARS